MKIPTVDEIIGIHKQVVNEALDEMIENLKNGLKNMEGYDVTVTFMDEDAELVIRALEEYRKKYK